MYGRRWTAGDAPQVMHHQVLVVCQKLLLPSFFFFILLAEGDEEVEGSEKPMCRVFVRPETFARIFEAHH